MIDFATPADLDGLVSWGEAFHRACPYGHLAPSSPYAIRQYIEWHILSTTACVLKSDTGMIGGVLQPALDYLDGFVVRESFLWCDTPKDGWRLVSKLEDWARMRKATHIEMSAMCNVSGERLGEILQKRKGYMALQNTYRLELK